MADMLCEDGRTAICVEAEPIETEMLSNMLWENGKALSAEADAALSLEGAL